ncbi:MAG: M1 family metallopeptidase [Saprospiraceae bacterium]|nr:M1 family metallopeptidase [Saprospiraceae bacterium]
MQLLRLLTGLLLCSNVLQAQPERWQQRATYVMNIDMDAARHQYHGTQQLTYFNNSPDTLDKVFFHLYFNAFQPGSMMDVRSRNIEDADGRVADRISKLKPEEQGWIKVNTLLQDGRKTTFETNETILEVALAQPILPNSSTLLVMDWDAQVPLQVRRSGRDNREGVEFSMTQWYPKLCEYDYQGWHANPYVAREFYGVWGDFDVTISIDKNYVVAAGGYLQNPQEVGFGYEAEAEALRRPNGDKLLYHFKTPNVHDFAWAADPDFTQKTITADDGSIMRFFWQKGKGYDSQWEQLPAIMNRARTHMNQHFGKYPYREYCFIQGGDGGMEYPLATLITGNRGLNSLVGVAVHEQLHSWYQMILGTNESLYGWMDEGFTSYAETLVENELAREGLLGGRKAEDNPFAGTYSAYASLVNSGKEEPLTTHADHFKTNYGYSLAAYVKGSVFLHQLEYVIGKAAFQKGLLRYFDTWKFKHPNANDCVRVFEKQSGLELDWYKEDFVNTLNTVDYAIESVEKESRKTTLVTIRKIGEMAMPLDVVVTYSDGDQEIFYAPLESMRGAKPAESGVPRTILADHRWVDPTYTFEIPEKAKKIEKVEIDPSRRMMDMDYANNVWAKK